MKNSQLPYFPKAQESGYVIVDEMGDCYSTSGMIKHFDKGSLCGNKAKAWKTQKGARSVFIKKTLENFRNFPSNPFWENAFIAFWKQDTKELRMLNDTKWFKQLKRELEREMLPY